MHQNLLRCEDEGKNWKGDFRFASHIAEVNDESFKPEALAARCLLSAILDILGTTFYRS